MEWLDLFLTWAWERHHNILSWYIRPLFLLPYCYFAYKRSFMGIVLTLIALASSMFWFPKPAQPDPRVVEFINAELVYLSSGWTPTKIALSSLVPLSLSALAMAFWKQSLLYGLVVLNAIAMMKIAWSFTETTAGGFAVVVPALVGLAVCDVVIVASIYWMQHRQTRKTGA